MEWSGVEWSGVMEVECTEIHIKWGTETYQILRVYISLHLYTLRKATKTRNIFFLL